MWTGHVSPVMRQKAKGVRLARNLARRAARRTVLPDYPVAGRAFSLAEVESYFKGDRLVCLRCGKPFRKLGVHLLKIHAMSVDDYRGLYGLPWREGLAGEHCKLLHSQNAKATIKAGKNFGIGGATEMWRLAILAPQRKRAAYNRELAMRNVGAEEYPPEMFDKVLNLMRSGTLPYEVAKIPGMPGRTWLWAYQKAHPDAKARFLELFDAMPYDYQRDSRLGMGPRFWADVRRLREAGGSDKAIAAQLGFTAMCINLGRRKRGIK